MSRPKGPETEKMGVRVSPVAKDWIRTKAIERYGSSYFMGRVVQDLVDAYAESEDAVQTWQERVHRFEQGQQETERVAREYAAEAKALRRQLERIRASHPGLVRRIAGSRVSSVEGSGGGQVVLSQELIDEAAKTLCQGGCGYYMDPEGLGKGFKVCRPCRSS